MAGIYRSRLGKGYDEETSRFISSLYEDLRMMDEEIDGTEAHDIMIHEAGIIGKEDLTKILRALEHLREEWATGKLSVDDGYEDIHEFLEDYVTGHAGKEAGGKLHTARSRNDQVALDVRMKLRLDLNNISSELLKLVENLLVEANEKKDVLTILYTHTQHAQIGLFSHHLLAQVDALLRDFERLDDSYKRVNRNPLGATAIAGTSFNIDRERTASLLGFEGLVENSIDAVSSRDHLLEVASHLAILMAGLSRMAEDLIVWSSAEFGFVELADEYTSPSSIMPQKKNPCTLELVRGKTGRVYGGLVQLLTTLKGLLTGYNRDLQDTKPPLWLIVDTVRDSLKILQGVYSTMEVNKDRMFEAASSSYATAVDLVEGLVKEKKLTFREAHMVVGKIVGKFAKKGLKLQNAKPSQLDEAAKEVLGRRLEVSQEFIRKYLDPLESVARRVSKGAASPGEQTRMLKERKQALAAYRSKLAQRTERLEEAKSTLTETVKSYIRSTKHRRHSV